MTITGTYVPSPSEWVRQQVDTIEETGTTESVDIQGRPVVLLTMNGVTGTVRKVPLMRVEHDGVYAAVASKGGAPEHPKWYANLRKNPVLEVQDGDRTWVAKARELEGAERDEWWARCVEAFPNYAEYQRNTERLIPVFALEPHDPS
ncbi:MULTISPECIES: nitroreductase family deazaflavin-dependent oxidoreductase [unclassified Knoellia]|uniref:nitroreductase family deazaflavin-dependent oxidoreductase n=1 Tax=Knoellia altitudinis TaxID=3404795 RepID=UPI00360B8CA8